MEYTSKSNKYEDAVLMTASYFVDTYLLRREHNPKLRSKLIALKADEMRESMINAFDALEAYSLDQSYK